MEHPTPGAIHTAQAVSCDTKHVVPATPGHGWPLAAATLALLVSPGVLASDLDYTQRGDWYEGLKSAPVSGFDLALVGATALPARNCRNNGSAEFALVIRTQIDGPIHAAVREEVTVYNYWLDQVKPSALAVGKSASERVFRWPMKTVLARLQQFEPTNLITITRVGSRVPTADDHVAMGMICSDPNALPPLDSYVFQFGVRHDSSVAYEVVDAAGKVVWKEAREYKRNTPLKIQWKPQGAANGRYILHLTTKVAKTAAVLDYKVTFDHLW